MRFGMLVLLLLVVLGLPGFYTAAASTGAQPSKAMVVAFQIIVFAIAIVVHETAHGWAAEKMGDPTARQAGRITLNPIPHIDIVGTIILPLVLIASRSGVVFGWAKPVPINPLNFRDPQRGILLSSVSGPASNFAMAVGFGIFLKVAEAAGAAGAVQLFCLMGVYVNVILGILNLVPIPPLDGSGVLVGILPAKLAAAYMGLRSFGFILIIVLFYSGILNKVFTWAIGLVNLILFH